MLPDSMPLGPSSIHCTGAIVSRRDEYEERWRDAIVIGCSQGVFTVQDRRIARPGLLSMCTAVSQWYAPAGPTPLADICGHMVDLALGALHAGRDGRRLTTEDVRR